MLSTLDLFERGFTVLTRPDGKVWAKAGRRVAEGLGIPLAAFAIGPGGDFEEPEGRWADLYGLGAGGAVLVRPDGHVAWRSRGSAIEPESVMRTALTKVVPR